MATKKIFTNLVSNGKIDANEFRPGDGTNGRFYSDSAGRMAFDSGQVYIRSGVGTYYNYAANQYHGSTTGTNHRFRGNYITANNWGIDTSGNITGNSFIKSGGTASQFLKANGTVDNSVYITGYTETDTLDTVADRGNSTNQTLTSTNTVGFKVDTTGTARIEIDSGGTHWSYLRLMDGGTTAWDIATYDGGNLEWRPGGGEPNKMTYTSAGILTTGDGFTSTKGNSAFSWGDHALAGYLTSASTQSKYIRSDEDDTTSGNLTMSKPFPKLILDSPGSGDNWTSQGAQISLGESGGGSAALHLTYNGGGIGHIGMGALSGTGVPSFSAIRFNYSTNAIYFYSNPSIAGSTNWHSGNDGASSGLDSDKLDGQHGTYYLDYNNFTNTPVIPDISSLVDGSGTANYSARWIDTDTLGIGTLYDNGTNVGIGTTNPSSLLHVRAPNGTMVNTAVATIRNQEETAGDNFGLYVQAGTNSSDISFRVADKDNSEYFRVRGDGNVGIGVNPNAKLDVASSAINTVPFRIRLSGGTTGSTLYEDTSGHLWFQMFDTSVVEKVRIRTNSASFLNGGNVGIGTTTPDNLLTIESAGDTILQINRNDDSIGGGNRTGVIQFGAKGTWGTNLATSKIWSYAEETFTSTANGTSLRFFTTELGANTPDEKMIIDTNGDVGIGIVNPTEKLHVNGDTKADSFIKDGGTSSQFLKADGSVDSNTYLTSASIGGFIDGSGSAGKIPKFTDSDTIGNSIITESSSKIGIGVASPKAALHVNGAVIVGNDTTAASADLAGALRYWDEQTGGTVTSYVDMCMKSACGYSWVNIVTNRTACL